MQFLRSRARWGAVAMSRALVGALSILVGASVALSAAKAEPSLVLDVATGEVLHQEEATRPWYPASLTKLMTTYVALNAVRTGRISLQTPIVVSRRAYRMPPSKMGFKPGSEITLENALKIIMVKSANDVATTIAEGVSGSVENFAGEMNAAARALGMTQSHFVNPHGLHNPEHVSSARDMAVLGRALYLQFPEYAGLYAIGALQLGTKIIPTHNGILGRYPGADGMKTGFVCASGFNVVASANRSGRRLLAVVLGAPSAKARTLKAMALFEAGFTGLMREPRQQLAALPASSETTPPNMRSEICGKNRNRGADEDFALQIAGLTPSTASGDDGPAAFFAADQSRMSSPAAVQAITSGQLGPKPTFQPVPIYVGRAPGWTGVAVRAIGDEPTPQSAETADDDGSSAAPLPRPRPQGIGRARKKQAAASRAAKPKASVRKPVKSSSSKAKTASSKSGKARTR